MINKFLYFYFFCLVVLADSYFIFPWLKPITLLNYILLLLYFRSKKVKLPIEVKRLLKLVYVFILYIVLIDFFQNDLIVSIVNLISLVPVPIAFYFFYVSRNNEKLIYFYSTLYLFYNSIFGILQFFGVYVTAGSLLANLPFLNVDFGFEGLSENQGLRISGASFSNISFACNLGMMFIFFYFNKSKLYTNKSRLFFLFLIVFLLILSQNRSALFSIIPVVIIASILFNVKKIKTFVLSLILTSLMILTLVYSTPLLKSKFPRLFLLSEDRSVIHRIQANLYGIVGTYHISPFIGVPFDDAMESINLGYKKIGLFIGNDFIDEVTHHNQPAFYFRYYGFIGIILFMLVYRRFFIISSINNNSYNTKKIIFSIVFFHILFSMLHNNKFLTDYYLWLFLSLNTFHNEIKYSNEQKT